MAEIRVLFAEDEFFVAEMVEEDLRAAGLTVVGPFTTVARAAQAAREEEFDIALLDINLRGELIYPLAEHLTKRGIPFVFLSGYGGSSLPEKFRTAPRLPKPYDPDALIAELRRAVGKTV